MSNLYLPISFERVLELVDQLSKAEKAVLLARLQDSDIPKPVGKKRDRPRIAGLGEGMITIAEDFDDPLPDEFWLGKDK
jgi:hypothetical protein